MGADEGRTSTPLTMEIDVTTDGEYEQHGEAKVVMTTEQLDKLAEVLDVMVDRDVVRLDWNEPETASFVDILINTIREARGTAV